MISSQTKDILQRGKKILNPIQINTQNLKTNYKEK